MVKLSYFYQHHIRCHLSSQVIFCFGPPVCLFAAFSAMSAKRIACDDWCTAAKRTRHSKLEAARFPYAEDCDRCDKAVKYGQPVTLWVELLNNWLLALTVEYNEKIVHLCTNPEECIHEWGPYHITIAVKEHVQFDEMEELRRKYNGAEMVIPVERVTSGYTLEISRTPQFHQDKLLMDLHRRCHRYGDRDLHISC